MSHIEALISAIGCDCDADPGDDLAVHTCPAGMAEAELLALRAEVDAVVHIAEKQGLLREAAVAEVERLRGILDMGGTGDEARAAAATAEERRISEGMALRAEIERLWKENKRCWGALRRIYRRVKGSSVDGYATSEPAIIKRIAADALYAQPTADKDQPDPDEWVCYESAEDGGCAGRGGPGCEGLECPFAAQTQADKETPDA